MIDVGRIESILGPLDEDVCALRDLLRAAVGAAQAGLPPSRSALDRVRVQLDEVPARLAAIESLQGAAWEVSPELERVKNNVQDLVRALGDWMQSPSPVAHAAAAQAAQQSLKALRLLRVPLTINQRRLAGLRVGYAVDFLAEYKKELADDLDEDVRPQVLTRLKNDRHLLGWVDEAMGVIYRASSDRRRRLLSLVLVFGVPLLGLIGSAIVLPLLGSGWSFGAIAVNYLFLFAGFVAHVVKKAMESNKNPLLDDLITWVHVREWQLLTVGVSMWFIYWGVGAFGFFPDLRLYSEVDTTSALTAFTIGFAADSVGAGVLRQYDRKVSQETERLRALLPAV